MLSFQVENIELFPEEYVNNELLASRMTNTRKHGRLWEIYRYYKDKKGFGNIDGKSLRHSIRQCIHMYSYLMPDWSQ